MATAPSQPLSVSVEEYLRTDYEPNCEYLDGVLVPISAPDDIHSRLQGLITAYLISQEKLFGLRTLPEIHTRITPTTWRVPDIGAVSAEAKRKRYPDAESPPLFTIEIVSLDEPWSALRGKVADHLEFGVSCVIIADPYSRTVMVASQDEPLHELKSPLIVRIPIPERGELQIDFDDLYSKL